MNNIFYKLKNKLKELYKKIQKYNHTGNLF